MYKAYRDESSYDTHIGMKIDRRTEYVMRTEKMGGKFFEFRIKDNVMEFRPMKLSEINGITFYGGLFSNFKSNSCYFSILL